MKKPKSICESFLTDTLRIPAEISGGDFRILLCGNREVFVENIHGILKLEEDCVVLKGQKRYLAVNGSQLILQFLTRDEVKITGRISGICYRQA